MVLTVKVTALSPKSFMHWKHELVSKTPKRSELGLRFWADRRTLTVLNVKPMSTNRGLSKEESRALRVGKDLSGSVGMAKSSRQLTRPGERAG